VSAWSRRVKAALRNRAVTTGIAQVAVEWMSTHIEDNYGRGPSGQAVPHKPLKPLFGKKWVGGKKPTQSFTYETGGVQLPGGGWSTTTFKRFIRTSRRGRRNAAGKIVRTARHLVLVPGYRNGGQPLRDTGKLFGSLNAKGASAADKIVLTMRGRKYGLYQDKGFTTSGPNYIPLTLKGKRKHGTGNNPRREGLSPGRDYFMARRGVTVPARPFILPTREDLRTLGTTIYLGLKSILKGT